MVFENNVLNELCLNITDGEHGSVIDDENSSFYLLSNKNIINGRVVITKDDRRISQSTFNKIRKRTKLEYNDLLISTVGTIGKLAIINQQHINFDFQRSVGIIKCDSKKLNSKYLYYFLNLPYIQRMLVNLSKGAVQKCLFISDLKDLKIKYPSLIEEQISICKILSSLDEKIEINNKINAELEAMAKTLYDYWFVQFDFPNEEGKPYKSSGGKMVWNEELKRDIPEGWEVKKLEEFGTFKNGVNYDSSLKGDTEAKIINVRNISNSKLLLSNYDLDYIKLKYSDVQNYLVKENDIIIARSGIPGAVRLIYDFEPNTIFCGFIIRLQLENKFFKNYIFFHLKNIEKSTINKSAGTIMQNVNQETLKNILFIRPNDLVIEKFNSFINPIFNKINLISKENQELATLRDWLLPMLMNGQVKVN